MHAVITLAASHDRYLNEPVVSKPGAFEVYHLNRSLAMLSQKLSMRITQADKEPIWAASTLMKGICIAHNYATCPEEAWPLNPDGSSPFDWINLQDGLHAIWQLISPLDPTSPYNHLAKHVFCDRTLPPPSRAESEVVRPLMNKLFGLDNDINNTYRAPAETILSLMDMVCDKDTIFRFFGFTAELTADHRCLLRLRDPRFLLLLAYWNAMVCRSLWHIGRRTVIECQAICMYLEEHHGNSMILQQLLYFPKVKCGLLSLEP
jgi:hypothetical protein